MSFESLNLAAPILRAVNTCGFSEPTPIQQKAVPPILEGRDLMASAQTGTGKTAAFVLPMLHRLTHSNAGNGHGPRVLILTPTRELATQVEQHIRQLAKFVRISAATVVGGMPYPPQMRALARPLDVLVATPGRLMDHMESGRVDYARLEMLILDEADRMLDMGFVDAVRKIAAATPASRQTVLFSATLEGAVLKVAKGIMKDPERLHLAANSTPHAHIAQRAHRADDHAHKQALLKRIIEDDALSQAVIFTATKRGAETLAKRLAALGHQSGALHGDMSQGQRRRTVEHMRRRKLRLLVATDVAARGLDINGISHVVNFDLPMVAEDYIHRIGRTGRGGAEGTAVSLIGPQDRPKLQRIERLTGHRLDHTTLDGLEPRMPERSNAPKPRRNSRKGPPRDFKGRKPNVRSRGERARRIA